MESRLSQVTVSNSDWVPYQEEGRVAHKEILHEPVLERWQPSKK